MKEFLCPELIIVYGNMIDGMKGVSPRDEELKLANKIRRKFGVK